MIEGLQRLNDTLTANAAEYLLVHPAVSQVAIALTLATGCYVVFAAPGWARLVTSDLALRRMLRIAGRGAGGCLILTAMFYDSIIRGLDGALTFRPLMYLYFPASIMLSVAAVVFAGAQIYCSLYVRPAPLLRAAVPAVLGAWLFALSIPVFQFAVMLGLNR
ncbi:hypothetical protein [Methylobacterium indicum]|uniref:Uncharacterized protein n=1 Tax=Methylobacterium indicum TaxID=1775910 RepID=A0A8H8X1B3_9HYPH|nr:hypothetical protein [Methylobacterium indicum]BCM88003.1 hypothetical protein mvi_64640 [Methylobacterium indicum]